MVAKKRASRKASPGRKRVPAGKASAGKIRFGRPGTAGKAEGDAAVRAWMSGVKAAHRPLVERLDALIGETVPNVKRAIKWSTPMYGVEGRGWFASVASFKNYVSLRFFAGASLDPPPPFGEGKGMRGVNIRDLREYDENQFRSWIKQASSMPGWGTV